MLFGQFWRADRGYAHEPQKVRDLVINVLAIIDDGHIQILRRQAGHVGRRDIDQYVWKFPPKIPQQRQAHLMEQGGRHMDAQGTDIAVAVANGVERLFQPIKGFAHDGQERGPRLGQDQTLGAALE